MSPIALALLGIHVSVLAVLASNLVYLRRTKRDFVAPEAWPSVSVLIPARNEAQNLRRLLPSLLAQDYPALEVVVMDDGSEDATWDVIASHGRVRGLRGSGPPPGWVGKVHALHETARHATGEVFVFLDADAELKDAGALRRLVARFLAAEARATQAGQDGAATSGLSHLKGGGLLLTSLVPFAILSALPLPLVPRTKAPSLSALNGQCWLIRAAAYRRHQPHAAHPDEVLEDVQIGRYLKALGVRVELHDLRDELAVWMYGSLPEAWRGFRKNAYLVQGGTPLRFALAHGLYLAAFVLAPLASPWLLVSLYLLKGISDVLGRFPAWLPLLAPLTFLLGGALAIDSAVSHWAGRVRWKGRAVAERR